MFFIFSFYTFLFNLVIFDPCDVVYNWSIPLLPPIVLDNLFGIKVAYNGWDYTDDLKLFKCYKVSIVFCLDKVFKLTDLVKKRSMHFENINAIYAVFAEVSSFVNNI